MSNENEHTQDENGGFASIGKRLKELESNVSSENADDWKIITEEPKNNSAESLNITIPQNTYTPKSKKDPGPSFRLTWTKVFFVIIGLTIILWIFSKNFNNTSNYKSRYSSTKREYSSPAYDDDLITVGQYRCTRYHHNRAQELKPGNYEKQSIENDQSDLSLLKSEIETDDVDLYSQYDIDRHNMKVRTYNSKLQQIQSRIDRYNYKVNTYNQYLMQNCRRAY